MPTYVYKCNSCSSSFERYLPLAEYDTPQLCDCGGESKKLISSFFYIDKTSANRNIDSIVGADAEKRWEKVYERKNKREKSRKKKPKKAVK